jgi:hypothetical protein
MRFANYAEPTSTPTMERDSAVSALRESGEREILKRFQSRLQDPTHETMYYEMMRFWHDAVRGIAPMLSIERTRGRTLEFNTGRTQSYMQNVPPSDENVSIEMRLNGLNLGYLRGMTILVNDVEYEITRVREEGERFQQTYPRQDQNFTSITLISKDGTTVKKTLSPSVHNAISLSQSTTHTKGNTVKPSRNIFWLRRKEEEKKERPRPIKLTLPHTP